MSDVRIFQQPEGGDIECIAGQITMDDGLASAAYLSLFGGNEDDSGDDADLPREWWANKTESDANKKFRSRTQSLLRGLPLTSGNLSLVEDAAAQDLQWMLDTKLADFVGASASIPALNWIKIEVRIEIQGKVFAPAFAKKTGMS